MEIRKILYLCSCATAMLFLHSPASAMEIDLDLALQQSQIEDNNLSNDKWFSGLLNLGQIVALDPNESVTINITFDDMQHIEIDDGFFNGDESIQIEVDGEGGTGGAPRNKADFSFEFTGVHGNLLKNPITQADLGQLTIGALTGNVDFDKDIDLINGGKLQFHDIHLTLTNRNVNTWQFDRVGVGVDGDEIKIGDWEMVPEPSTLALFMLVVLVFGSRKVCQLNV